MNCAIQLRLYIVVMRVYIDFIVTAIIEYLHAFVNGYRIWSAFTKTRLKLHNLFFTFLEYTFIILF